MTVKSAHETKRLTTQKEKLKAEISSMKQQVSALSRTMSGHQKSIEEIDRQLEKLVTKEIVVTEHALLRYLQRGFEVNLEELKDKILSPTMIAQIDALGNGKYPIDGGLRAVVKDRAIVTVE